MEFLGPSGNRCRLSTSFVVLAGRIRAQQARTPSPRANRLRSPSDLVGYTVKTARRKKHVGIVEEVRLTLVTEACCPLTGLTWMCS